MNILVLKVQCLSGSSLQEAIRQAKTLASTMPIAAVEFYFNGVRMFITDTSDISENCKRYNEEIRNVNL